MRTLVDRARRGSGRLLRTSTLPLVFATALALSGCSDPSGSTVGFDEVTLQVGLPHTVGMTYGAFWGDYDLDGRPDVYVTNHYDSAQLFKGEGGERFADTTRAAFGRAGIGGDNHGAAWADFDNDGDLDLVQLGGAGRGVGAEAKQLLVNSGGTFEDVAGEMGVTNPQSRTRMPLWLDVNGDGRLDLFHGAEGRFDQVQPPYLFLQTDSGFAAADDAIPFDARSVPFCIVTQLNEDPAPELVCRAVASQLTARIFDTASLPARELDLLPVTAFEDLAAGDFDNDGRIDLFMARNSFPGPIALGRPGSNTLVADVVVRPGGGASPRGFRFRTAGELEVRVAPAWPKHLLEPRHIRIGEEEWSPASLTFRLSAETAGVDGLGDSAAKEAPAVYIGRVGDDTWQVQLIPPEGSKRRQHQVAFKVVSSEPITDREAVGAELADESAPARLFMNRGGKLVEESDARGVNAEVVAGVNVVAGDFDNDMDLDLYVLASGLVGNHPNLLLLNRGDGHFERVRGAGGAAGPLSGVGDSVTTVDYDGDGFLDLFVTTGGSMGRSLGIPSDAGGYHLYRNRGNGNRWLMVDIEGTRSNRDGIGARVEVTAGGVTQVRVQDGGVHHRGQNHSRLHFGLGPHEQVERIRVQWPSGTEQERRDVKANQVLAVTEPAA